MTTRDCGEGRNEGGHETESCQQALLTLFPAPWDMSSVGRAGDSNERGMLKQAMTFDVMKVGSTLYTWRHCTP